MYIDWFSYLFGAIVILVIPMMAVIAWFSTYSGTTRYERLEAWQFVTLLAASMLAAYTYFYVRPYGDMWYVAEAPLWMSAGVGAALSLLLEAAKRHVKSRQNQLETRLREAVLSR